MRRRTGDATVLLLASLLATACGRSILALPEREANPETPGSPSGQPVQVEQTPDGEQPPGSEQPGTAFDTPDAAVEPESPPSPPPVPLLDAGSWYSDADRPPLDPPPVTTRECERNTDCPLAADCQRSLCGSDGSCTTGPLPDHTPCETSLGYSGFCVEGSCQPSICGDGFIDARNDEECEDGNTDTTDGCIDCQLALCGDGYLQAGLEECDPRNDIFCRQDCTPVVCGDGLIDSPAENCEPSVSDEPCNDTCRISDSPEWLLELQDFQVMLNPVLLLDSSGNPIVVYVQLGALDSVGVSKANKYAPDGQSLWSWTSDEDLLAYYAALDSNDQIVLGGRPRDNEFAWMAKVDTDGLLSWFTTIEDRDPLPLYAAAAAEPERDRIAVVRASENVVGDYRLFSNPVLEFFDADGTPRPEQSPDYAGTYAFGVPLASTTVNGSTRYLMAGAIENGDDVESYLLLLDAEGALVWNEPLGYGLPSGYVAFMRARFHADGDIVVLGIGNDGETLSFFLERFDLSGTSRWGDIKWFREGTVTTDLHSGVYLHVPMAVDDDGNTYLGLSYFDSTTGAITIGIDRYGPDGSPSWERPLRYDEGFRTVLREIPLELALDDQGVIYLLSLQHRIDDQGLLLQGLRLHKWRQPED